MPRIVNKYQTKLVKNQKDAVVVRCAGREYSDTISNKSTRIQAVHSRASTANKLIRAMTQKFRITNGANDKKEEERHATALGVPGVFASRKCYHCGEDGHSKKVDPS